MASPRPIETLYSRSKSKRLTYENADAVGRAAFPINAIRAAITKMRDRGYQRAEISNDHGTLLYRVVKQTGGIQILRVRGEPL